MYNGNQFVWRSDISPLAKLILLFLCETSDYYGRCEFSEHTIASACSLPIDVVRMFLDDLQQKKIIVAGSPRDQSRLIDEWKAVSIVGGKA